VAGIPKINMLSTTKIIKNYFKKFTKKDLEGLRKIFNKNIILIDWDSSEQGIKKVMYKNKKIFTKFKKIKIRILNILKKKNLYCIQMKIYINSNIKFFEVVDLITVKNNKIIKIHAYKC
jgi:hypothetical protein